MQGLGQLDRRTRQLLEEPVVPTLLIMAIPNALVMFARLSIGLIEVYFLARLGVDILAGVSLVFSGAFLDRRALARCSRAAWSRPSPALSVEAIANAPATWCGARCRWP